MNVHPEYLYLYLPLPLHPCIHFPLSNIMLTNQAPHAQIINCPLQVRTQLHYAEYIRIRKFVSRNMSLNPASPRPSRHVLETVSGHCPVTTILPVVGVWTRLNDLDPGVMRACLLSAVRDMFDGHMAIFSRVAPSLCYME